MELSIPKLLFFILMPIVYRLIYYFFADLDHSKTEKIITHIMCLSVYYSIELIFIFTMHHFSDEWIIMKNNIILQEEMILFVSLASAFIILHFVILVLMDLQYDYALPWPHLVLLILFFSSFLFMVSHGVKESKKAYEFEQLDYQIVDEYTIHLKAFSGNPSTTGSVTGTRFYLSGKIQADYEVYYSFIDEKGSTIIRHFPYDENLVEIYEESICDDPRIEFTVYSKSLEDLNSTYTKYIIYIPEGTNGMSIGLE